MLISLPQALKISFNFGYISIAFGSPRLSIISRYNLAFDNGIITGATSHSHKHRNGTEYPSKPHGFCLEKAFRTQRILPLPTEKATMAAVSIRNDMVDDRTAEPRHTPNLP